MLNPDVNPRQSKYFCALESPNVIAAFLKNPPDNFTALNLDGTVPSFIAPFNLLTTLDAKLRRRVAGNRVFRWVEAHWFTVRTLFVGTTVSEYVIFDQARSPASIPRRTLDEMSAQRLKLTIIKDIPSASPLLSADENAAAKEILAACRASNFTVISGQALAYVPVDYASIDDYLKRVSHSRRKDLRRKLKSKLGLSIEEIETGEIRLQKALFRAELYSLYEQVFAQSETQFDKLSAGFFDTLLTERENNGRLICYSHAGKLIGFNLCFVNGGNLVDKYVGFRYPDARDLSLYVVSWFYNLELAKRLGCRFYIAGWTDLEIKRNLGASFTMTYHAIYFRNPVTRTLLKYLRPLFESDASEIERRAAPQVTGTAVADEVPQ